MFLCPCLVSVQKIGFYSKGITSAPTALLVATSSGEGCLCAAHRAGQHHGGHQGLQLQIPCHISVIGKSVCISNLTVLAAVQVASPSGRAVFEMRGLPDNTTVDLKVCGPIESGGTISIYRDGAFLWCATPNVI